MEPIFLTLHKVVEIHAQQIEFYGGSAGVRDSPALESAVDMPETTFNGRYSSRHDSDDGGGVPFPHLSERPVRGWE